MMTADTNTPASSVPADKQEALSDPPPTEAERARRQSDLLDEALEETFPASDPISVARVR